MKTNSLRPPEAPMWKMTNGKPIGCGICEEDLWQNSIAGVDADLGPICFTCEPHLKVALKAMYVAMRRA